MKILRVASDLAPYILGGIGLHADGLSIKQSGMGDEITVFTCIPESNIIDKPEKPYHIVNFGRKFTLFGNTFCLNMFPALLKNRYKYDVIDAHSHLFISTVLCAIVRKMGSSPLIVTNHGLRSQAVPKSFQEIYLKTVARFVFNTADCVITFTDGERHDLIDMGVHDEKIAIIPNAVNTDMFVPAVNRDNHIFTAIWVGRFSAGKGIRYAILGFAEFLKIRPESMLYVVGDGPYYEDAVSFVTENNLDKNIIFTGRVENSDMIDYYQRADVYLMTSMSEGFPRTLLEALSCGLPIICTDIPQLVPIVKDCGVVIHKKDVSAVCGALSLFESDTEMLDRLSAKARECAVEKYSLDKMVSDTRDVYLQSINWKY